MAEADKPFLKAIVDHAWSADHKRLAVAPNESEVFIYNSNGRDPAKWEKKNILTEHEGFVSAIDWCASTGQLVTCGHDRNAYVWEYDGKEDDWKPTLVILRINRAATAVKWSPSGKKFAVASGAKCIPVCHYEASNNWWISKMIKKHKSTVTSLDWSPNNKFLVTGSTDFKARVVSAFVEGLDSTDDPEDFGSLFKDQHVLGEILHEFGQSKGWVNAVAYAPDGMGVAFAGQSSTIHFASFKGGQINVQDINQSGLPYLDIHFLSNSQLVAVGFDLIPAVYCHKDKWVLEKELDSKEKKKAGAAASTAQRAAFNKFADADKRGADFGAEQAEELATRHTNVITRIRVLGNGEISTSGLDGRILYWKI
jgi:actin related protein 2/3 complex subunit 1A/1B